MSVIEPRKEHELKPEMLALLQKFLESKAGLRVDGERLDNLSTALKSRVAARGVDSYHTYYCLLNAPGEENELVELLNVFTVNETYFFRTPEFFEIFRERIIPDLLTRKVKAKESTIRIWSGACSTGEEPYSIALALLQCGIGPPTWDIEILASDVSQRALRKARQATYTAWSFRNIRHDDASLWQHFAREGNHFTINPAIQSMIRFEWLNLIVEPYPFAHLGEYWDLIFLRNVLMYFERASACRVLDNAFESLRPDGCLFLGESEPLFVLGFDKLAQRDCKGVLYYQKDAAGDPKRRRSVPSPLREPLWAQRPPVPRPMEVTLESSRPPLRPPPERPPSPRPASLPSPSLPSPSDGAPPHGRVLSAGVRERVAKLYEIAEWFFAEEQLEKARWSLERVLELDPRHQEARIMLANVFTSIGMYDCAQRLCDEALAHDDLSTPAHLLNGIIRLESGEPKEALAHLRKALYLNPHLALACFYMGRAHEQLGDHSYAMQQYTMALGIADRSTAPLLELGFRRDVLVKMCHLRMGLKRVPREDGSGGR